MLWRIQSISIFRIPNQKVNIISGLSDTLRSVAIINHVLEVMSVLGDLDALVYLHWYLTSELSETFLQFFLSYLLPNSILFDFWIYFFFLHLLFR